MIYFTSLNKILNTIRSKLKERGTEYVKCLPLIEDLVEIVIRGNPKEEISRYYERYRDMLKCLKRYGVDILEIVEILSLYNIDTININAAIKSIVDNFNDSAFWFLTGALIGYAIYGSSITELKPLYSILKGLANIDSKPPITQDNWVKFLCKTVALFLMKNYTEKEFMDRLVDFIINARHTYWKILGLAWLYAIYLEGIHYEDVFDALRRIYIRIEHIVEIATNSLKNMGLTSLIKVLCALLSFRAYLGPLIILPARLFYMLREEHFNVPRVYLRIYSEIRSNIDFDVRKHTTTLYRLMREFEYIDFFEKVISEGAGKGIVDIGRALEDVFEKLLILTGFRAIKFTAAGFKGSMDIVKGTKRATADIIAIDDRLRIIFVVNCTHAQKILEDITKTKDTMRILRSRLSDAIRQYKLVPVVVTDQEIKNKEDYAREYNVSVIDGNVLREIYSLIKENKLEIAENKIRQHMLLGIAL